MEKLTPNILRTNASDHAATVLRAMLGVIPLVGPLIPELVDVIIPNQRRERTETYLTDLDARISKLEIGQLSPLKVALFEDGWFAAVRAVSTERIHRINIIVSQGLAADEANVEHHRLLLRILETLNDEDCAELIRRTSGGATGRLSRDRLQRLHAAGALTQDVYLREGGDASGYEVSSLGRDLADALASSEAS